MIFMVKKLLEDFMKNPYQTEYSIGKAVKKKGDTLYAK